MGRQLQALVVDDSLSMRNVIGFVLREAGYAVTESSDGAGALLAAKGAKFDLVLTDVDMPVMDGLTFVRELRAVAGYEHTPILVVTTNSNHESKLKGRSNGATGWVLKPFDGEKLLKAIGKVIPVSAMA